MLKMTQIQVCNIQLKTPGAETETECFNGQ